MAQQDKKKEEEPKNFVKYLIPPHNIKSREVEDKDLKRVVKDAHIMYQLCYSRVGIFSGGKAVAHSQITKDNPLRFFVTKDKEIVINPVVVRHSNYTVESVEGCLSFPETAPITVQRYNKMEVKYQTLTEDLKLSEVIEESLKGLISWIFQHEIEHFEAQFIYEF